jgi:signal transduction histidine kinase/ActR/RegA family two-component response regulator
MNVGPGVSTAIDLLPEPILFVTVGGVVMGANSALATQLGMRRTALEGMDLRQIAVDSPDAVLDYLGRCARSGQLLLGSLTLRGADGRLLKYRTGGAAFGPREPTADPERAVLLRLVPALQSGVAFMALNEKIRELSAENARRRLIEDELRKERENAREADRRKDEFLATLAHELRNPLAPIRNAMQILARTRGEADAKSADVHRIVERQLNHMVRLIDDLMDLSRITQGRLELHQERVELGLVIKIAAETSLPLLDAKRHRLRIVPAAEPIYLHADVTRLAQVFSNLLNNSAKYSPVGSDISIIIKREGADAVVEVIDAGVGIPPALIPRIFDMFVQLNPPGMREGLGIGLALVKRIMELHGGSVEVLSAGEGQGSTFRIRLTAAQAEVQMAPAFETDSVQAGCGTRILVVDDNRDAADTLTMMLELAGHEVRTAYDGSDALQMAEVFRPRVMLLDIGMPHMDGYQTARHIRDRAWSHSIVLVALTGWGQEQDRRRTREAGFDHHFVKPVDPQAINRLIDQAKLT